MFLLQFVVVCNESLKSEHTKRLEAIKQIASYLLVQECRKLHGGERYYLSGHICIEENYISIISNNNNGWACFPKSHAVFTS